MDPLGRFRSEYPPVDSVDSATSVYLDNAGAAVPSQRMLAAIFADLASSPMGNPHSSSAAQDAVNGARSLVLAYFNLSNDQYDVVFTSGATAAMKLVGESFPFGASGTFAYPLNAHTSLLGLRCYSENVLAYRPDDLFSHNSGRSSADDSKSVSPGPTIDSSGGKACYSLLGTVGECNFSGARIDLSTVADTLFAPGALPDRVIHASSSAIKQKGGGVAAQGWCWLLDASKLVQSARLLVCDLEPERRPHFIALSFYKMFGYPTGLGALLLRRDASGLLRKRFYGGGTVLAASAASDFTIPRSLHPHQWLEDGSSNFYAISALKHGFALIERLGGIDDIQAHTAVLASYTLSKMLLLTHYNNRPLCRIYSGADFSGKMQGPIIAFNVCKEDASMVGFGTVLEFAKLRNICVRSGCFCNVGACALALCTTPEETASHFARGRSCDSASHDIIDGKPTGAVRISFGPNNTFTHCDAFLAFLRDTFLSLRQSPCDTAQEVAAGPSSKAVSVVRVEQLYLYPIKSCGGTAVLRWPLTSAGLSLDRAFAVVDNYSMTVLSQKAHAEMALIVPSVDAGRRWMTLSVAPGASSLYNLEPVTIDISGEADSGDTKLIGVCGRKVGMREVSPEADKWLTSFFNKSCSLVRYVDCDASYSADTVKAFSNTAEFLVVSRESLQELSRRIHHQLPEGHVRDYGGYGEADLVHNFRPNIVVSGGAGPHFEDHLSRISIGGSVALSSCGPCERCSMVDVGRGGRRTGRVLAVLAGYRRAGGGRMTFGQLMRLDRESAGEGVYIETGSTVTYCN